VAQGGLCDRHQAALADGAANSGRRNITGRVTGKKALVTGAAQGLGAAIAHKLAQEGARVLLTDINAGGAADRAAEINQRCGAGTAFSFAHDVTSEAQWIAAVAEAKARLGGLSVLVNNAGIGLGGTVESTSLELWERTMAINSTGPFLGCKHALPLLRDSQPASIVNISSIAAFTADPFLAAYNASKAAVWMLSKSVALYCARAQWQIRCNSVHPAFVDTAILEGFRLDKSKPMAAIHEKLGQAIPMGRIGTPEEVALGVLYLASDESSFMTGSELKLDGGLSAA
jgi:NAD(P)-dependent dehydrogenase (short-subunit alcohol dehydrogenase family)